MINHKVSFVTLMYLSLSFGFVAVKAATAVKSESPFIGLWHLQGMSCESRPNEIHELRPLPLSNFHPDLYLSIAEADKKLGTFRVGKSVTGRSCTKALPQMYQRALLTQTYFIERIIPNQNAVNSAEMTGVKIESTWANPDIQAVECDTALGILQYILPLENYSQMELDRKYNLEIEEINGKFLLKTRYFESDNTLCAIESDQIILHFQKL
jgi:hypothetical protein